MNIIKINKTNPDKTIVKKVADIIVGGGVVVYPTDTAYGIGVDTTNKKSIENLYRIKNRKPCKPTHVVVKNWEMINKLTVTNKSSLLLYEKFMPGPLTLILKKKAGSPIPEILTGNLPTLGVRIPDCKITKMLSEFLNVAYTTPSANREGEPTPYSIDEVNKVLDINLVDIVLDTGKLDEKTKPSTLVDLSGDVPKILREGPITKDGIQGALEPSLST